MRAQDRKKLRYTKLAQLVELSEQRTDWVGLPRTEPVMRIDLRDAYVLARPTTDVTARPDLQSILKGHFSADLIRASTIPEDASLRKAPQPRQPTLHEQPSMPDEAAEQ